MFWRKSLSTTQSTLLDQDTFYKAFVRDMLHAKNEVVIESPFITTKRIEILLPTFSRLARKGVRIVINTKPIEEHEVAYQEQARRGIRRLHELDAVVLFTGGHHRKLAIIDRTILYEGSLNILSQNDSCEIMRRIDSPVLAEQMLRFIGIEKLIN